MSRTLVNALRATSKFESCCGLRSMICSPQLSRYGPVVSSATYRLNPVASLSSVLSVSVPDCLFHPMDFPHKTLMGPGPSNASPRVLGACALPLLGHLHPEFTQIMDQVKEGIRYAFQTTNDWTFAISGTGHAAMEAVVANLMELNDVALVCQNGIWGQRFADMVERNGSVAHKLVRPMGEVFTLQEIEQSLKQHKPLLMFITHGESSGGTAQPLEGLGDLCRKYNCLLVVDSVAAMGGVPLYMDKWGVDCLYSGSQKVLGAPPGTAPISFSDRARKRVETRSSKIRSYYFDAGELANYWGCDAGVARRYHHTGPISSVYALREGLAGLADIGLEESWARHQRCAEQLHEGIHKLGLSLLVKDKTVRNPCVTPIIVPDGIAWKDVTDHAMKNYKVEISGGLGELAGKVWRIGIMGHNCTPDNIRLVLRAFTEALVSCGYRPPK